MIGNILSTARGALIAHQIATQITAHNTANATTPGFSRQRVELVPATPLRTPAGSLGTGTRVADISRVRDTLLDVAFRREQSAAEGGKLAHDLLARIEGTVGEPGEHGFGATLDAFWNAWADLANDPGNGAARGVIRERGQQVADHLGRLNSALDDGRELATSRVRDGAAELNASAQRVALLNRDIVAAESGGRSAPDLRDERDRLLDGMARLTEIQVVERGSGAVSVIVGGVTLVDESDARRVSVVSAGGSWTLATEAGRPIGAASGAIGEALDVLNRSIPALRSGLDTLARGIAAAVNAAHRNGTTPLGATGVDFFDESGGIQSVTAGSLRLSAAVLADSRAIAAGTGDAQGGYRAGAGDVALALGALGQTVEGELGGVSVNEYYGAWVTGLALATSSARQSATAHELLLQQASLRRESVSGVSTDEEMVKLIQQQAAYAAAARLVTAADDMLRTLIGMV